MRTGSDQYVGNILVNGFDYSNQAWVVDGKFVPCGHVNRNGVRRCSCFGTIHAHEPCTTTEAENTGA